MLTEKCRIDMPTSSKMLPEGDMSEMSRHVDMSGQHQALFQFDY